MKKQKSQAEIYDKTELDNGLTVISEQVPGIKSVAVGVWVKTGSRHESEERAGITHFLEHMLFKGTESRSSYDIALSMESVGGYLNAFTSSEYTCYYARCLDEELDTAVEVLSDMILHPSFPEEEVEKEKKVVLEEMKMYRDSPDDYAFENFTQMVFKEHPLGRPVIGYEDSVQQLDRSALYDYMEQRYVAENMYVTVAGSVDHNKLVDKVKSYLSDLSPAHSAENNGTLPGYNATTKTEERAIEQTHYLLGRRGLRANHKDKYTLLVANTILSGGMSSRLHQNIREKHGYCYNIQTFNQVYSDTGIFGVYAGTDAEYLDHMRELIIKELDALREESIDSKELQESKTQLKGKLLLAMENTSGRMTRLAKSEIYFGRFISLEELVENINSVTASDIREFADSFFDADKYSEFRLIPEDSE